MTEAGKLQMICDLLENNLITPSEAIKIFNTNAIEPSLKEKFDKLFQQKFKKRN